jgi:hypothetical protein
MISKTQNKFIDGLKVATQTLLGLFLLAFIIFAAGFFTKCVIKTFLFGYNAW